MSFPLLYVFIWSAELLLILVLGLGSVAFITLLERKILGLTQSRLGPNKVSFLGLLQPVSDGVKLLLKENFRPFISQELMFVMMPILLMTLFLFLWASLIPWNGSFFIYKNMALLFFSCLAMMAYAIILVGWSSTSAFSKMGSQRGILQSLSYEVAFILIFLWGICVYSNLTFVVLTPLTLEFSCFWVILLVLVILMEGNRAPFDLLEGESELISGFNIEMGSLMFVYLFLSEYGMILFMAALMSALIMNFYSFLLFLFLVSLILLFRSCYPRVRYDSLMGLMWKSLLPVSTLFFCWVFFMKM